MEKSRIFELIVSSSAAVYGEQKNIPISEKQNLENPTNPYGRSKLMIEMILEDLVKSDSRWSIGILRYFNPIGAHESGMIGENTKDKPDNLVPYIMKVALGKLSRLSIYGNDYPTSDGTAVRDYIHIVDLAHGHLATLKKLKNINGLNSWNLGTGKDIAYFKL